MPPRPMRGSIPPATAPGLAYGAVLVGVWLEIGSAMANHEADLICPEPAEA